MSLLVNSEVSIGHVCRLMGFLTIPRQCREGKILAYTKNAKGLHSFLGLASYYQQFIGHFDNKAQSIRDLISPVTSKSKQHDKGQREKSNAEELHPDPEMKPF